MNLSLKADVAATNGKLKDYQIANGLKIDKDVQDAPDPKIKAPKRKLADSTDRSGLIKGLKKVVAPKPMERYDPFQGMPVTTDYFKLSNDYETPYSEFQKDPKMVAGGYNFQEALEESLVRAFAGFGVFIEDERAGINEEAPKMRAVNTASDDVF